MHKRGLLNATALAVLLGGVVGLPATAAPAKAPPGGAEKPQTVTLITGDQVTVAKRGGDIPTPHGGSHPHQTWDVQVRPAQQMTSAPRGYLRSVRPDGVTVIPTAAAPLVRSGQLDPALFDVTGLIKLGYDDAHTAELPLLVESTGPAAQRAALGRVTRELPAAKLAAVSAPKTQTSRLFDAATAGSTKIWLNGKAFPTLDVSVPQVGAPAAWQAGHTGAGATVAVLDTGFDPTHPDLTGIVTGERDFVGEPTGIRDTVGHGTHVASTVAGRGAASGGKYTGVAKGANLLIGKVCAEWGCPFDAILAGMQWAADSGAKVVNMSLGGGESDGTDPISAAVNRISAERGTLFVIAAGNSYTREKVSSPAAADAALAVASVTKQDQLSDFSSRGPRIKDFALKPDIAAPGSDIVAARAAGTLDREAVDEHHARLSGTSMATPHVAGAAAILAAQHPDWNGERLKSALMNASHPVAATVYEQGAGRLDVARAVNQTVTTSPASLSMGFVGWPGTGAQPSRKELTYSNSGTSATTFTLSLDVRDGNGQPAPAGMFRADATEVTVPAGGTAKVAVTWDPSAGPTGTYGGWVLAKSGATEIRTAAGGYKEPESYNLTLKITDRNGAVIPPGRYGYALVQSLDNPGARYFPVFSNEPLRLPIGRYAVMAEARTAAPGDLTPSNTAMSEPELTLSRDTVLDLDARRGKPVSVQVDERDARIAGSAGAMTIKTDKIDIGLGLSSGNDFYVVPTTGKHDFFNYYDRMQLEQPVIKLTATTPESFEVPVGWAPNSPTVTDSRRYTAVDVGHARADEIAARDIRGKLAVFTLSRDESIDYEARVHALHAAGAAAALFYFSEESSVPTRQPAPIPVVYTLEPEGARLAKLAATGTPSVTLAGIVASPFRYELAFPYRGGIPADVTYRPGNQDLGTVKSKYHAMTDGGVGYVDYTTHSGDLDMGSGLWSTMVPVPIERTVYYSAGQITWGSSFRVSPSRDHGPEHGYLSALRTYRPGERVSVDWGKAVVGPRLAVSAELYTNVRDLVFRDQDTITASLPLLSDGSGHSGWTSPEEYSFKDTGDTALYANGKLVSRSNVPGEGTFTVPGGKADYRLTTEVNRNHPSWPLSTKVSAEWTFSSAHADKATPLPLLTVGFDPKLDLNNYAKAGSLFAFPVRVDRQPGSTGGQDTLRTVEVSYDDGTNWQRVPTLKIRDQWWATVAHPKSGYVSLRATASDNDGNTVNQTIIRAYRLR